jgi:hypothetical protein
MITLNHSINLVTEINEHLMPPSLLARLVNLDEAQMEKLLRDCFIGTMSQINALDKVNEGNTWATVKFGDN